MNGDKETSVDKQNEEKFPEHLSEELKTLKESETCDEAEKEKLVSGEGKLKTNKEASEVKFVSVDTQNGDAKIDIENIKAAFFGMGKDELMKFANDPFWVRIRWTLFILFWLIWVAMLAGAIAIIVMAPKCAPPRPLKWWEEGPLYNVEVRSFKDGGSVQDGVGDLKGLESKLDYIKSLGAKGICLSQIVKTTEEGSEEAVEDFMDIDPKFGSMETFKELLASVKAAGLHLIMTLVPNHTSKKHPWFIQSENNTSPYNDYYVWHPKSVSYDSDGNPVPPNNWPSVMNGSAWEWSPVRKQFYLHQFGKDEPDLNFHNPNVVNEFKEVLQYWLNLGVSGFHFEKVAYLLEDPEFAEEEYSGDPSYAIGQYGFYSHAKTLNQPRNVYLVAELRELIHNHTESGVLSVGDLSLLQLNETSSNMENFMIADLPHSPGLFSHLKDNFDAIQLNHTIQKYLSILPNTTRAVWQLTDPGTSRVATRLSEDYVDGLNMVTLLLPGTPVAVYGEELGMADAQGSDHPLLPLMSWSNTSNAGFTESEKPWNEVSTNYETANVEHEEAMKESHLRVYKQVAEERSSESIKYGSTEFAVINGSVFAFTRMKKGNPGYLVVFNTADKEVKVSFETLSHVPQELTVHIRSSNFNSTNIVEKAKLEWDEITLVPKGAVVFTFVPKAE